MVTVNNPASPFMNPPINFDLHRTRPRYVVYQLEQGEEGTPHFQMYVAYTNPVRGSTLSRSIGGQPHLEVREGNHIEVIISFFFIYKKNYFFFFFLFLFLFFGIYFIRPGSIVVKKTRASKVLGLTGVKRGSPLTKVIEWILELLKGR